eukprot:scaffold27884_cov65-Phaeocystis_antarctica.AAC.2
MRHCCAHWPRLAERPPHASLEKHCPLYETHMCPCTKISTLVPGTAAVTAAMSEIDSSRVSTTVRAPRPCAAKRAPSASEIDICVEACSGSEGATACSRDARPTSCTMRPSTPAASAVRASCSACAISFS